MMRILATDLLTLSSRTVTPEGFLEAPAVMARTGVQDYLAGELGLDELPPNKRLTLYRPPEEVFARAAIASFDKTPITLRHPPGNRVTADNWGDVAVGDVHDPVACSPVLHGAGHRAQRRTRSTPCSAGSRRSRAATSSTFDMTAGTLSDGTAVRRRSAKHSRQPSRDRRRCPRWLRLAGSRTRSRRTMTSSGLE